MRLQAGRNTHIRVPKNFLDYAHRCPGSQHDGRATMAEIVKTLVPETYFSLPIPCSVSVETSTGWVMICGMQIDASRQVVCH